MPDINLAPTNYELEAIQKRRKMAELLGQQAIQPIEMPQVPGARISPIQGIAKLLQAYISSKNLKKADTEEKQYQSDYLSDLGFLMRNAGKSTPATEAIPEKIENITTPIEANRNLQEIALRQSTMRDPNAAINPFERQMGVDERAQVATLPGETVEQRVTPAIPAMKGSPLLSPDLLSGNNANNYIKTSAGKMALAQLLMQQQAQQQAAALKSQEVLKRNPEEDLYRVVDGKVETVSAGKPKASPVREIKTIDKVTGMPVTRYVPENVLQAMGDIPDQYKGFALDLIMAKNLPAQIMNDPQLLNLVGAQLNKQAGLVTQEDVAQYMLKVQEARAKLGYEGIPFAEPKPLAAATNPLIKSMPLPPQGNQLINGQVYDTPKGRGRWNGTTFTLVD